MKNKQVFWAGLFLLCISVFAAAQEVDLSIDYPDEVKAGESFQVTVTIDKGALRDYSRFSQDLPLGLSAENLNSPNADFSFDNQRIRIIWLKLPEDPKVQVSYNVFIDKRLKGTFELGGVFAFVVSEERKFINVEISHPVKIIPNADMDPAQLVDIKVFKGGVATPVVGAAEKEAFAMVIRQVPVLESSGAYLVKLLVKNPQGSKYAKVEESIPAGYMFESVDSHDGIESFSASTVKFIWMKLPGESEFEVSYRLVPKRDETQGEMSIDGKLTYSDGNENKVVLVKQLEVDLAALSSVQKKELLLSGVLPSGATKPVAIVESKPAPVKAQPAEKKPAPVKAQPAGVSSAVILNTRVLAAGSGVYYRVQLAAYSEAVDGHNMYRGVSEEVFVEKHSSYYKYTSGSFTTYEQAALYKDKLNRLPAISGAFVVKYQNGKRVRLGPDR